MRRRRLLSMPVLVALAACTGPTAPGVRILVPNDAGSGYDVTARVVATTLADTQILRSVDVFNLPGAGGTVGLRRMVYESGNPDLLMLMGQGVVGAQHALDTPSRLSDLTPIARLITDPEIIVVDADSPFRTMGDLAAAWRADPSALSMGGGSTPGGPDHLVWMFIARELGIAPADVAYAEYDGGGELLAAVLGGDVAVAAAGASEYPNQIASGRLRVLGVTGQLSGDGMVAPRLSEIGIDVEFANWRGLMAPPGLSEAQVQRLRDVVHRLHGSPQWRGDLERYEWTDAYLPGEDFAAFIAESEEQTSSVLAELGLQ